MMYSIPEIYNKKHVIGSTGNASYPYIVRTYITNDNGANYYYIANKYFQTEEAARAYMVN